MNNYDIEFHIPAGGDKHIFGKGVPILCSQNGDDELAWKKQLFYVAAWPLQRDPYLKMAMTSFFFILETSTGKKHFNWYDKINA